MNKKTVALSIVAVIVIFFSAVAIAFSVGHKDKPSSEADYVPFEENHNIDENERAPYGIKIMSVSDLGIQVYWKNLENISGYELYRAYEKNGEYELVTDFTDLSKRSFYDTEFDRDMKKVYYKVTGYFNEDTGRRYTPFSKIKAAVYREAPEISDKRIYIASGTSRKLEAFLGWGNMKNAVWSSDDEAKATVDENGNVTGVSKGECKIICTGDDGVKLSCKVTVDREADDVMEAVNSRFIKGNNGVWYDPSAKQSQDAVILMAGDMMCMGKQQRACRLEDGTYDFNKTYAYMKEFISSSDFAIGNLETAVDSAFPYSCDESYTEGMPNCNAPSRYIEAIRYGGFDAVVTANNHSADAGVHGVRATISQVDKYKLAHTGTFSGSADDRTLCVKINGINVGFLSYATGYNSKDSSWLQEDIDTLLNYYEKDKAQKDIEELRQKGAEYVIVYIHWGTKNNYSYNQKQTKIAHELADLGVDYIVGSHPHLVQPYVTVASSEGKSVPCIYSLGDFSTCLNQVPGNLDSVVLRIRLKRAGDGSIELVENNYIPFTTYLSFDGVEYPTVPLNSNLNGGLTLKKYDKLRERIKGWIGDEIEEYDPQG